ncbi:HAD family hydrolase [Tundrisphaera sp. TA3]|uniref:HAD family hydrolase n=1 Tax=Tundrisphaera sp. TA3 TaxID=3435775 RepID=UPI003EC14A6A
MTGPTPIRAVVFDLDGTMFDTEALFFRVASEMLQARGKRFTLEIMRAMIGRQGNESGLAFKTMTGLEDEPEALMAEARERFMAEIDAAVHPTPGLFALLDRLIALGIPRAVATSSRRAYAERLLKGHGLFDNFAFVLAAEDVAKHKPDPEIYRTAAARLGVPTSSVLVLEDTPTGLAAAKAAGTFAVGVPHEHSPAEDLGAADLLIDTMADPRLLSLFPLHPDATDR